MRLLPPVGVGEDLTGTKPVSILTCPLFPLSVPPPDEFIIPPTPPEELCPKSVVTFITASYVILSCSKMFDDKMINLLDILLYCYLNELRVFFAKPRINK